LSKNSKKGRNLMQDLNKQREVTEKRIEENKKVLQSLLRKKENLENNILQIENRIRNLELSLKRNN
jgi:transcription elongation GreA/GreB family factor